MSAREIDAAARAWFDRSQADRRDDGRKGPDGLAWSWDDLTEGDRNAYRVLVAPIVDAVINAGCGEGCDCRQCRVDAILADDIDIDIDVEHIKGADGRCRISVNGQGHLPCEAHAEDAER